MTMADTDDGVRAANHSDDENAAPPASADDAASIQDENDQLRLYRLQKQQELVERMLLLQNQEDEQEQGESDSTPLLPQNELAPQEAEGNDDVNNRHPVAGDAATAHQGILMMAFTGFLRAMVYVLISVPGTIVATAVRVILKILAFPFQQEAPNASTARPFRFFFLSYPAASFTAALLLLWYALRSRQQWYLALVFLSSSRLAMVVLGNALVAFLLCTFHTMVHTFLHNPRGLRLVEYEMLTDFFRWNVTETCFAFTMFRSQLSISTCAYFVLLVLGKCLHYIAELREQHIRMTQEALFPLVLYQKKRPQTDIDPAENLEDELSGTVSIPMITLSSAKLLVFLLMLQSMDIVALHYTITHIMAHGPTISIMFAFESAILLVQAWSRVLLWTFHVWDDFLSYVHDHYMVQPMPAPNRPRRHSSRALVAMRRLYHTWKEFRSTMVFAMELQSQAIQFILYASFFGIVMTYYGPPMNLFRELYVSFMALKDRVLAFFKYRQLIASMDRFDNATADDLMSSASAEAGEDTDANVSNNNNNICIICRDEMMVGDCKKLPGCQHIFHKSCLREWLVQQQTCPTCRSDIITSRNTAVARGARNAAAAAGPAPEAAPRDIQPQAPGAAQAGDVTGATSPSRTEALQNFLSSETADADGDEEVIDFGVSDDASEEEGWQFDESEANFGDESPRSDSAGFLLESQNPTGAVAPSLGSPPSLPALYKVVHFHDSSGSDRIPVYKDAQDLLRNGERNELNDRIARDIPAGTIVMVLDRVSLVDASVLPDISKADTIVALKLPDGWMDESNLQFVYAL
jgi:E3 ubiquitin-protein ligase synoviolin